jgi:uncharacterized membrane protein
MKWLGPVVVVALAVLAEVTLGRAGGGPDFALFFGRFHPLVVHLPIGFFLLVAMGEAASLVPELRDRVEPALGLLVPVSALAALAAFLMGQLLSLEGGFPAAALGWHRRLTLLAVIGMAACWVLYDQQRERAGQGRTLYRAALAATLGLLSLGAHFGGTMTRGESYLSKYAPGPLKPLLGAPEASKEAAQAPSKPAAPTSDPLVYQDVLQPILTKHCQECHGPEKQKGKLRVDSLELLLKGGESGAAVSPGDPKKSLLLTRMLLPVADDDHMPPEGKPSPKPEELALIQFWIERGATPTLKVRDALAPAASRSLLEHALGGTATSGSVPVSAPAPAPGAAAPALIDSAAPPSGSAPAAASPNGSAPSAASPNGSAPAAASPNGSAPSAASPANGSPARAPIDEPESGPASSSTAGATPGAAGPTSPASLSARAGGVSSGPAFLATYCEKCHGASKQKGKLRVDSLAALVQGGANGTALVPGKPERSSVVQRVRLALDNDDHMPPKKEPQPSASEISVLAAWIRSGAASGSAGATANRSPTSTATGDDTSTAAIASPPSGATSPSASPSASGTTAPSASGATSPSAAPSLSPAPDVSGPPEPALLQSLPPEVALFSAAVQPLFREKCGKCHIRDKPAGGLGVEGHAALIEGGYSGAGIVPKNRPASFVMQRLTLPPTDEEHMPPEGEPALSADEVELVGAWIDQGAPASGPTETAKLSAGAARALAAHGIKGGASGPAPLPAQSGGCAACSVLGAPRSQGLPLQAVALLGASLVLTSRRLRRLTPS